MVNDASKDVSLSPLPNPTSSGRQPVSVSTADRQRVANILAFMTIFILLFIPWILLQFGAVELLCRNRKHLMLPCYKTIRGKNGSCITPTNEVEEAVALSGKLKSALSLDCIH